MMMNKLFGGLEGRHELRPGPREAAWDEGAIHGAPPFVSPCLKGVGAEPVGYDRAGQTLERGIHYLLMG